MRLKLPWAGEIRVCRLALTKLALVIGSDKAICSMRVLFWGHGWIILQNEDEVRNNKLGLYVHAKDLLKYICNIMEWL
jgi:hypothetical protein